MTVSAVPRAVGSEPSVPKHGAVTTVCAQWDKVSPWPPDTVPIPHCLLPSLSSWESAVWSLSHCVVSPPRRYVQFLSGLLSGAMKMNASPLFLHFVILHGVPSFDTGGGESSHPRLEL